MDNFNQLISFPLQKFGIPQNVFPQSIFMVDQTNFLTNFSNNDIGAFSLTQHSIQLLHNFQKAHEKRINDFFVDEGVLISCSNDGSVKLWDTRTRQKVHEFKTFDEIFCIAKSKHILAGGANGKIIFWDLLKMQQRKVYDESHADDVTSLKFNPHNQTQLLSGSVDGMMCLFDLNQEIEEDAIYSMIRLDQPINYCDFYDKMKAYSMTTINTISLVDLEESTKILDVSPTQYSEENQQHIVSPYVDYQTVNYFLVDNEKIQEFSVCATSKLLNSFQNQHKGSVTCIQKISNNCYLTGSEDSSFKIQQAQYNNLKEIEHEIQNRFSLNKIQFQSYKTSQKQHKSFNPY